MKVIKQFKLVYIFTKQHALVISVSVSPLPSIVMVGKALIKDVMKYCICLA